MKNKITDLNNYLFEQIEILNDEELTGEKLEEALKKSKAIADVSSKIIQGASVHLKAIQTMDTLEFAVTKGKVAEMLGFNQTDEVKKSDEEIFKEAYRKDPDSIKFINKN